MNFVPTPPKLFISYSHDSPQHKDLVLELADRLRRDGIDCNIDQYEQSPSQGWPQWRHDELCAANFVLIVCTELYNQLCNSHEEIGEGKDVIWEWSFITQNLYDDQGINTKYIPIVFVSQDLEHIPQGLKNVSCYNLEISEDYENLLRRLTNQPWIQKPTLGFFQALPPRDRQQYFLNEAQHANLRNELLAASQGLLNWKRTLGDNEEIERPELDQLLNRIDTEDSSTTIVLGDPGSGKSALLANLGHRVVKQGYTLLAIKADFLSKEVKTLENLRCDDQLKLSLSPKEAIKVAANQGKVIFLVDQLDAISELLDRDSGRLNVLLTLIQSLAGTKGVHIVATCREFEFRYGSQFARLEGLGFEQLKLILPTWEKISPLLEHAGHIALGIGEPLRELLRNPLNLEIFLKVAQPGEVFESSQKLLDRLWETRILNQANSSRCISFLEKIADRMTQEEVLWLPTAAADTDWEIYQTLVRTGILITNPNSTFGFCHQTYYDHTLARAFARGYQSLVDLVLQRQDGLFVRPILLRGLNYLRGTAPKEYAKQLRSLLENAEVINYPLKNKIAKLVFKNLIHLSDKIRLWALSVLRSLNIIYIRTHIYSLLIEFVGSQQNPEPVEAQLLIPLLNVKTEAPKVLDAIIGSRGWFNLLYNRSEFRQWLEKPPTEASCCLPILFAATSFASDNVWNLIEEYWLCDNAYDGLSMRIISYFQNWNLRRVQQTQEIIRRYNLDMNTVCTIAENVAKTLPQLAPEIVRVHLDYKLAQAIVESNKPIPELSANANDTDRYFHASRHNPKNHLKKLLESSNDFEELNALAKANPQYFLDAIWSWFTDVISRIVEPENPRLNSYLQDYVSSFDFDKSEIIQSILSAILELVNQDRQAFLIFAKQNYQSEFLLVHRLLVCGLVNIVSHEPQMVLNYLLGDSRRLSVGDYRNTHKETKRLLLAICQYLQPQEIIRIEQAIRTYKYCLVQPDIPPDLRRNYLKYNRQHRLKLILAIPEEYLSEETKRWRDEEIRAFPGSLNEEDKDYPRIAQIVGPPMTIEEMNRASDQDLLNLFGELANITEEDYWKHQRDISRAGGASSQALDFGKLIKDDPQRFLRILPYFQPQRHEIYAGHAIRELAEEKDFPANILIELVESLEQRGFVSEDYRTSIADALEKISERNQGLPQSVISLLENWLSTHSKPELENYRSKEEQNSDRLQSSIIFNLGTHILPSGRCSIISAIASGYLKQNPPDLQNWARVIQSRLGLETHPEVWVTTLAHMPALLNSDRTQATQLFDTVIRNCPEVLKHRWSLDVISRAIGWFEPTEIVQGWLEMLLADGSSFCLQTYGELLFIHYFQYQDEWSVTKIDHHLTHSQDEAVLCGLAHAASHMWFQIRCRTKAAEILYNLSSSNSDAIQNAVARVFFQNRQHFILDSGMHLLIPELCKNKPLLLKAASDIIEIIENYDFVNTEPELMSTICQNILSLLGKELENATQNLAFAAESLTTLAIQLHRQDQYREVGLSIFEQLLSLNLRQTRPALELLDRKPNRLSFYQPLRIRRHRLSNLQ